ncbi:MAG: BamA/TamA family outer membrane protein [Pseudomonadota bacterium]
MRKTILIAALAFAAGPAVTQTATQTGAAPEARLFNSVAIEGNRRFDDRDILATAGLNLAQPLTEADLSAAVEALYFTGEFEHVRIHSQSDTLFIVVEEEAAFRGGLTFGLGFDSDAGVIGSAGLRLQDIIAPGVELSAGLEVAEEFQRLRFDFAHPDLFGDGFGAGLRLSGLNADPDDRLFAYREFEATPYLSYRFSPAVTGELRAIYRSSDIRDVAATASPIIAADEGRAVQTGLGIALAAAGQSSPGGFAWQASFEHDVTGFGGDYGLQVTRLRLGGDAPLGQAGFRLRSTLDAGHLEGRGGDVSRLTDRFVLGGASLRGFEGASIAPRDVTAGDAQVLGGTDFAALRTDFVVPVFRRATQFETFVFFDVGAVWGLDSNVAPAGVVDADRYWRSSAGLGLSLDTDFGRFEAYYALTEDAEATDETRAFGLTIRSQF